jgi:hypothetical protein
MMGKAKNGVKKKFHSAKPKRCGIRRGDGGWKKANHKYSTITILRA